MNTILWTQNESPLIHDTIVVDGTICKDKLEIQNAFNILNSVNQNLCLSPKDRDILYKKFRNIGYSHQANFYMQMPGVYIQGCFLEEDNVGRKLPYMFYDGKAGNFEEALETLIPIANTIGRNCNKKELEILDKISKKNLKKKLKSIIVVIVIVVVAVILISLM